MVIRTSSARQLATLVADLGSDNVIARDAAVARLIVLGGRSVDRLTALVDSDAGPSARIAALRALEAIAHPRALEHVLAAVRSTDAAVAAAAVSASRPYLRAAQGAAVVDCLAGVVMDPGANESVRVAALRVLRELEPSSVNPLLVSLKSDPCAAIRAELETTAGAPPPESAEALVARAASTLPEQPGDLLRALSAAGSSVPLSVYLSLIKRVREREDQLPAARRARWTEIRGRAHLALAGRRSRIALYDLREAVETTRTPLPADFLAALSKIGDKTCVDAIAAAYARSLTSSSSHGEAWRAQLAEVFQGLAKREKLTRRHAALKKIEKRWGIVLKTLLP